FLDRSEARFIVNDATLPCVLALQTETPLPFAPRGDTDPEEEKEKKEKEKKEEKKDKDKEKESEKPEKVEPIKIDFEGLVDRFVQVPVAPANYTDLSAIKGKLHWLKAANLGMMPYRDDESDDDPAAELQTYDIEKEKLSTLASKVKAYAVSLDRKVL